MTFVEEKSFELRFELRAEFGEDYQGELDGYEWAKDWTPIAGEVLAAVREVMSRHPGWSVRTRNRGRSSEDEVTLVLTRKPD